MNTCIAYLKREPVMFAAVALAIAAVCAVRPSAAQVAACIDLRVLSQLFCLMLTIQAFRSIKALDALATAVLRMCSSVRLLFFALTGLVFFVSMAVTNDVALLTFVPLTLVICRKAGEADGVPVIPPRMAAVLVVLETLAANLGSCITPMGNPQNLFLYAFYRMEPAPFFAATLRIGVPSLVLLCIAVLFETRSAGRVSVKLDDVRITSVVRCTVYACVLVCNLLAVFRVIDWRIALAVTVAAVAVCGIRLFANVDYSLLLTFIGFFIFTGTIASVPAVSGFLKDMLRSPFSVYAAGIAASQVISNVPAALLLSGFTAHARELLLGVNVGGLGTLIASLASVISYKLFNADKTGCQGNEGASYAGYFRIFTVYNVAFLAVLAVIVWIV